MVTVRIDGMPVSVPEGTSVMRAAAMVGANIPKLCATDNLNAFGSCRLCLVEIEGRPGTPRFLYHAMCRRYVGSYSNAAPRQASQGRDGTLYF